MKRKRKIRRRAITLIEMIVVMLLIAIITGSVAYNYNESLNEGKAFKTREGIQRIKTIVTLKMAEDPGNESAIVGNWEEWVKKSPLIQNPKEALKDGWGGKYNVSIQKDENGEDVVEVHSAAYDRYCERRGKKNQ